MPSTYTQNLGIEQPATGEQAGTWGVTANTSYATIDTAICGSVPIQLSASTYNLTTSQGGAAQNGVYPLILWTGSLAAQGHVLIQPNTAQKRYTMVNNTSGGQSIAFSQVNGGTQFVLQNGYAARIYADGAGPGAGVFAELANPQFNNVLAAGTLQVNGGIQGNLALNSGSLSVAGNLSLSGWLGVAGAPSPPPDPLTVDGIGQGQIRLAYGSYGVVFRNDGSNFLIGATAAGDVYGVVAAWPFELNIATQAFGLSGWGPNPSYALNVPTVHASAIAVDGNLSAGGAFSAGGHITAGAGFTSSSGRSTFIDAEPYAIVLQNPGAAVTYIGTNASSQFQVSNQGGSALLLIDQAGNATIVDGLQVNGGLNVGAAGTIGGSLTVSGNILSNLIHSASGGFQFPDNTVQTTASRGWAPTPHSVAPQRVTNNVYTNTTGLTMVVVVGMGLFANSYAQAEIGPATSSLAVVDECTNNGNSQSNTTNLVFIVPPGWVYQVLYSSGAFVTPYWTEYY